MSQNTQVPKVTVAIPTYNRSALLKEALQSALAQDYQDMRIVVIDNASPDDTAETVRSLADSRVTYIRNERNIGLLGNLNRALAENSSPYLTILLDDDVLVPSFIRESVEFMDNHPSVGISFTLGQLVDADGNEIKLADVELPPGVTEGARYLQLNSVKRRGGCLSTAMMRATALSKAGPFDSPHTKYTLDVNLYYRIARDYDVGFIPKELVLVRLHPGQDSDQWEDRNTYDSEYVDALSFLITSRLAEDPAFREQIARRLRTLNRRRSEALHTRVNNLYWKWEELLEMAKRELGHVVPKGATIVLVDEGTWGSDVVSDWQPIPFVERDGVYWGAPPDGESGVEELERLRRGGATFVVFGWPAFWWLDHYAELEEYLQAHSVRIFENTRIIVFKFNDRGQGPSPGTTPRS